MGEAGNSLASGPYGVKRRVSCCYDSEIGNYYYAHKHPMKPHRIRMAHSLVVGYGLHKKMKVYGPYMLKKQDLCRFHEDDYINFLETVTPHTQHEMLLQLKKFNVGEDCPVFDGMFNFCQSYAGGSVGGAIKLNRGDADIAINWAGGLHHAKRCMASGFCYVNDIVLAILELLKHNTGIVVSLDPVNAVCDAMLRNQKVEEFRQSLWKGIKTQCMQGDNGFFFLWNAHARTLRRVSSQLLRLLQPQHECSTMGFSATTSSSATFLNNLWSFLTIGTLNCLLSQCQHSLFSLFSTSY